MNVRSYSRPQTLVASLESFLCRLSWWTPFYINLSYSWAIWFGSIWTIMVCKVTMVGHLSKIPKTLINQLPTFYLGSILNLPVQYYVPVPRSPLWAQLPILFKFPWHDLDHFFACASLMCHLDKTSYLGPLSSFLVKSKHVGAGYVSPEHIVPCLSHHMKIQYRCHDITTS